MLLSYGFTTCDDSWGVDTKGAIGYFRVYYLQNGSIIYKDENGEARLEEKCLHILPNTTGYEMHIEKGAKMTTLYLHVTAVDIASSRVVSIKTENYPDISKMVELFRELIDKEKLKKNIALQNCLCDALINILSSYNVFQSIDRKISNSIEYMIDNISKNISVQELAEICGYHPKYYIKLFSDLMGVTPYQYIITTRMKIAFSLLVGGETISEVALKVGYSEAKNFTRVFKEKFGIVPSKINDYIDIIG